MFAGLRASWKQPVDFFARPSDEQLKGRSVRGGAVALAAQAIRFIVQTGSVVILARLLTPADYGLQGMVLATTGILALFGDIGLGAATIQRDVVTHEQLSAVFWINIAVGLGLTVLTAASAPLLVAFYHEPRLFWITIVSAPSFAITGAAAQHRALLQRTMRYVTIAKIDIFSLVISFVFGMVFAKMGYGYWALVAMAVAGPVVTAVGSWVSLPWLPSLPRRGQGVRSMLHFGGTITLNNLVVYVVYNVEKVLLGRSWGSEALGLYGRAYQLLNLPLQQLHTAMYAVAFPALSQIQGDIPRLRRSFLRGYPVLFSLILPIMLVSLVFADEIVQVLLGDKWLEVAAILRFLTPTIFVLAVVNPLGWILLATGRTTRSLNMALMIAPVVVVGILVGLPYGPKGVAFGYSVAMCLLLVPLVAWALHNTGITVHDCWDTTKRSLLAGLLAATAAWLLNVALLEAMSPVLRLTIGLFVGSSVYAGMLLLVMGQKDMYKDLIVQLRKRGNERPLLTAPAAPPA